MDHTRVCRVESWRPPVPGTTRERPPRPSTVEPYSIASPRRWTLLPSADAPERRRWPRTAKDRAALRPGGLRCSHRHRSPVAGCAAHPRDRPPLAGAAPVRSSVDVSCPRSDPLDRQRPPMDESCCGSGVVTPAPDPLLALCHALPSVTGLVQEVLVITVLIHVLTLLMRVKTGLLGPGAARPQLLPQL